jgi:hypothetical protein
MQQLRNFRSGLLYKHRDELADSFYSLRVEVAVGQFENESSQYLQSRKQKSKKEK